MIFNDKLNFDKKHKTVISCRDGYQEYYGQEIGLEPADKIFKVYRSPDTIKSIKDAMNGIPITDEHIEVGIDVGENIKKGEIKDSEEINVKGNNDESVALKHKVEIDKRIMDVLYGGKIEVSLGYTANLKEHDVYDLEQVDIVPHHLAVVSAGRCGKTCKFKDKGNILEEILKLIGGLTEEQKKQLLEKLGVKKATPSPVTDSAEFKDALTVALADAKADYEKKLGELKVTLTDKAKEEYKAEVIKQYEQRASVCDKASKFLGKNYDFKDKDVKTIMADALAKEYPGVTFEDGEITGAFKALELKQVDDYKSFGDKKANSAWDEAKDMEV